MLEKMYLKTKESAQACDKIIIKRSAQFFCVQSDKCLCRIKSRSFLSVENVILDEQGNEKYYTGFVPYKNSLEAEDEGICERYAIFDNTSKIASAYTIKANINKKQSGLIIPRIFKLFVDFSGDMFMICRMEDNSFCYKKWRKYNCYDFTVYSYKTPYNGGIWRPGCQFSGRAFFTYTLYGP